MIGRGALGNPWLFARLRELCAGRPDPGPPGLEARLAVFRRHVDLIEQLKGPARPERARDTTPGPRTLHEVRKACAWYARGLYGCNALRLQVWEAPVLAAARALVEAYFAQLLERQHRLGLPPEMAADRVEIDGGFGAGAGDEAA
jgi:tRNA-dihydrouridine synthase